MLNRYERSHAMMIAMTLFALLLITDSIDKVISDLDTPAHRSEELGRFMSWIIQDEKIEKRATWVFGLLVNILYHPGG